jgi:hypothetical protein
MVEYEELELYEVPERLEFDEHQLDDDYII